MAGQLTEHGSKDDLAELPPEVKIDLANLEARLNGRIESLDEKLDTVAEAISEARQATERRLDNYEHRFTRLERHAA